MFYKVSKVLEELSELDGINGEKWTYNILGL